MNKMKLLLSSFSALLQMVISYLPGGLGDALRYRYWRKRLKNLGKGVRIDVGVYFQNPEFISIDDNCWIDRNVMILAGNDTSAREKVILRNPSFCGEPGVVHIGKNVHVGAFCVISGISAGVYISDDCGFSSGCKIYAFSHHYRSKESPADIRFHFGPLVPSDRQCIIEGPVFIGTNTGIALNSVILPGAAIPENCFVAVGSVVTRGKYDSNSILSGNPAKKTDERFRNEKNKTD